VGARICGSGRAPLPARAAGCAFATLTVFTAFTVLVPELVTRACLISGAGTGAANAASNSWAIL